MTIANKERRLKDAKINAQGNIVESDVELQLRAAQADVAGESIRQVADNTSGLKQILTILAEALANKTT